MGRSLFALTVLLVFLFSDFNITMAYEREIKSLSSLMSEKIAKAGRNTIAVVDFTDLQGNVTELGRFVAEEFSVALAGAEKGFEVIDRIHLKTLLKEHKLAVTDIIDPSTARKLGQIAGVQALITGTITPFGDSVRLSVKILDTTSAKVIGASSEDIAKTKAIEELLAKGIEVGGSDSASMTSPSVSPSTGKAIEAEGFILTPKGCSKSGNKVLCTVSFENSGEEDKKMDVLNSKAFCGSNLSHFFDNLGNQYPVTLQVAGKRELTCGLSEKFVPHIPLNLQFKTEGVSPEATHLTIAIGASGFKKIVALRNIPIGK